jgi:hypothetical protein
MPGLEVVFGLRKCTDIGPVIGRAAPNKTPFFFDVNKPNRSKMDENLSFAEALITKSHPNLFIFSSWL